MSINVQHMGTGRFSVRLSPTADVNLADKVKFFGHILFTPQRVDHHAYSDASMKAMAHWTGIVTRLTSGNDGGTIIQGPGLLAWLGDQGRVGRLYENDRFLLNQTLTNSLTSNSTPYGLLRDDSGNYGAITPGTITDPTSGASTYSGGHIYQTQRQAIEHMLGVFGRIATADLGRDVVMEYRINADGTMDVGEETDLFTTTPTTVIFDTEAVNEYGYSAVAPRRLAGDRNSEGSVTRTL
ncbi:MAG: hypothetical protein R3324_06400, partial [Halobacteriales archaeon]|nr:hypothetical protein [Halobacteriales archaeon]